METSRFGAASVVSALDRENLSAVLEKVYRAAKSEGTADLAAWCRLELEGYFASNPAMTDNATVPEYRAVGGQDFDIFGRVFVPPDGLAFLNTTRLRYGVGELEQLAKTRDTVVISDLTICSLIREHLNAEVHSFHFSSVHLVGVMAAIRAELVDRLPAFEDAESEPTHVAIGREIINLRPNLYGVGIDLRALWHRLRRN